MSLVSFFCFRPLRENKWQSAGLAWSSRRGGEAATSVAVPLPALDRRDRASLPLCNLDDIHLVTLHAG
jgi:hypothetical protein